MAPGADLRDLISAEVDGDGIFEPGVEGGDVLQRHDSGMVASGRVSVRGGDEVGDRPRDESGLPLLSGRSDPLFPCRSAVTGCDESAQHVGVGVVEHQLAGFGYSAFGHPLCDRGRPVIGEEFADLRDRPGCSGEDRMPVVGIVDGEVEDVCELPRPMMFEQIEPRIDSSGNSGSESPGAGNHIEALAAEVLDRRRSRGRPLAHHHLWSGRLGGGGEDPGHVTAGSVEVGFDDVEDEGSGDGSIEGVPAAFEHRLRCRSGQPVRRCRHPEVTFEGGARGERWGRGKGHGRSPSAVVS